MGVCYSIVMQSQITTIKNDAIPLPKTLRGAWRGAKIWIDANGDTVTVKRLTRPSLDDMLQGFRKAGKELRKKDVDDAVRWARSSR